MLYFISTNNYKRGDIMKKTNNIILICAIVITILIVLFLVIGKVKEGYLLELNLNKLKEKIENKETFVLCISKTTCSHCNDYKPKLKSIASEYNIDIYYIDVDKYDEEEFSNLISFDGSTPTTIFIKNGDEETTSNRINGDVSKSKIIDKLKSNDFIK